MTQSSEQNVIWLTQDAYNKLQAELEDLKGPLRQQIIERISAARDEGDVAVAGKHPLDLLETDLAAADDQAVTPLEAQARDIERRFEHAAHTALIADTAVVLTDAFLAFVLLGRHWQRG
mgnify:CR=1 FL=1